MATNEAKIAREDPLTIEELSDSVIDKMWQRGGDEQAIFEAATARVATARAPAGAPVGHGHWREMPDLSDDDSALLDWVMK
jgi:hypothetical protein